MKEEAHTRVSQVQRFSVNECVVPGVIGFITRLILEMM